MICGVSSKLYFSWDSLVSRWKAHGMRGHVGSSDRQLFVEGGVTLFPVVLTSLEQQSMCTDMRIAPLLPGQNLLLGSVAGSFQVGHGFSWCVLSQVKLPLSVLWLVGLVLMPFKSITEVPGSWGF